MKTFRIITGIFLIFIIFNGITNSQDYPVSAGPAPYVYNKTQHSPLFDAATGTRAFVQISSSTSQFGKTFMESCAITNIGGTIATSGGLVNRNGVIYTWNQSSPFQLWSIDTVTGNHTLLYNMTGVPQANLTGMCWDGTTMYGLSTNLIQSQIFTVNMTTGVCTPVGTPSTQCTGGIMLLGRLSTQGRLYALDIVSDNSFRINKTTGVFLQLGPLGVDINFGQDGSVDPNDNTFYVAAYTTGPELRKFDTASGLLGPVLCTYTAQATGLVLVTTAPPWPPSLNLTFCRGGLNLPINDFETTIDSILVFPSLGDDCIVIDVNVRIDSVFHTWDSDLSFYLQRNNIGVKIINRVGGSGDNFTGTILNDSAVNTIESGTAPFTGSYRPSNPLVSFNGNPGSAGRYWKLLITDSASGDTGILSKWCLVITMTCPTGGIQTVEIPNYYSLSQNYPNPFNPVTSIKFSVPRSENVKLVVYDLLGKEAAVLVNENKNPGIYEVSFDASGFASGVYFYSIQISNFTQTKKMLLVK